MVFLTTEQATATSTLHLGYRNSIYVAPEVSRLRLTINGKAIVDQPIGSAEKVVDIVAQVPNGTLQAGTNVIRIEAQQRHRTDCTIQSTYELWTEIDPSRTFIAFANATNRLSKLEDIPAVGVNPTGQTEPSIVVPSFGQSTATSLIRLSEGLAILAGTPHQSFEITRESGPQSAPLDCSPSLSEQPPNCPAFSLPCRTAHRQHPSLLSSMIKGSGLQRWSSPGRHGKP